MPKPMPLKRLSPQNIERVAKPVSFVLAGLFVFGGVLTMSAGLLSKLQTSQSYSMLYMVPFCVMGLAFWLKISPRVVVEVYTQARRSAGHAGKFIADAASRLISDFGQQRYLVDEHSDMHSVVISSNEKLMPLRVNFKSDFNEGLRWKAFAELVTDRGLEVSPLYRDDDDKPYCYLTRAGIRDAKLHLKSVMRDLGGEFFIHSDKVEFNPVTITHLKVLHRLLPTLFQGQREASALYAEDVSALTPLQSTFNNNYLIREIAEHASHHRLTDKQMNEVLDENRVKHLRTHDKDTVEPVFTKIGESSRATSSTRTCARLVDRVREPSPSL